MKEKNLFSNVQNKVSKSAVQNIPEDSEDFGVVQTLCATGQTNVGNFSRNAEAESWDNFYKVLAKVNNLNHVKY